MTQSLNCSDARHLIHLSVGDDTLPNEEESLATHLSSCEDCRTYHSGMADTMHVLESIRTGDSGEIPTASLWPAMADRLQVRQAKNVPEKEGRRFNVSVAALCACSLALAFVTAIQSLPSNQPESVDGAYMQGMNVNYGVPFPSSNQQPQLMQVQGPNGQIYLVDRRLMTTPQDGGDTTSVPTNKVQF